MIHLPGVLEAAAEVQQFCHAREWKFCFIGGVAVQRWGEPRSTQDVDLTLVTGFGREESFADEMLRAFAGRRADARDFALRHRVLLVRTARGIAIDVAFGGLPFEERCGDRASRWLWTKDQSLVTCSAEDLVVHKVFAGRERDWADVESVLIRQHAKLDLALVRSELGPLLELKGAQDSLGRFEAMLATVNRRLP